MSKVKDCTAQRINLKAHLRTDKSGLFSSTHAYLTFTCAPNRGCLLVIRTRHRMINMTRDMEDGRLTKSCITTRRIFHPAWLGGRSNPKMWSVQKICKSSRGECTWLQERQGLSVSHDGDVFDDVKLLRGAAWGCSLVRCLGICAASGRSGLGRAPSI